MFTNNLKKIVSRRKKRVGRGGGSGKGFHTVGRGQKGQTSRAGYSQPKGFQGGQVRLNKNLPVTRGFKSLNTSKGTSVSIIKLLDKGVFEIDNVALSTLSGKNSAKLVGASNYENYDLGKVVVKKDVVLSTSLKEKILSSGGKVEE